MPSNSSEDELVRQIEARRSDPAYMARLHRLIEDNRDVTDLLDDQHCPFCPDGHRKPGSKPMAVMVGPERDKDGQPTTLHITYANGHHISESEAVWLRRLLSRDTKSEDR